MDKRESLKIIVEQAGRGELTFPTNTAASLKLQEILGNPDCNLGTVAELALAEPLIAARLVSIGNSVAYTRFGGKVNNVKSAVSLLGLKTLRSLVMAIIVRQFGNSISDPRIRNKSELLWQHCANVAALARVIAHELGDIDPETALFAGVVHEISGFYLLSRAAEFPALLDANTSESSTEDDILLARSVLHALKVPKPVALAVESLYNADAHSGSPVTLSHVLALANDLASVPSSLDEFNEEARLRASGSLDLVFEQKTLRMILAESENEIKSTLQMLLA